MATSGYNWKSSRVSSSLDEPVFTTKFVTTWILPPALRAKYGTDLITEQIKKIGGLDTLKIPEVVTQDYKHVKRSFVGSVVESQVDLEMDFEVNVQSSGVMYPFNIFRDWNRICHDISSGFFGLKKDYVGGLVVELHRKDGLVLRKWDFPIIFPKDPINAPELAYAEEGQYVLTMGFRADPAYDDLSI